MSPEASDYLAKARRKLVEARKIAAIPVPETAAREAYLAAFLAAEALIAERTNKATKTQAGVQAEFHRLSRSEAALDPRFAPFLSRSYEFKTNADYAVGDDIREVSDEEVRDLLETAGNMIVAIEVALSNQ